MSDNKKKKYIPKKVPYNSEAECFVLGCVFVDNKIIDTLIGKLTDEDFYDERNAKIFTAMVNIRNHSSKEINAVNVVEEIKRVNDNVYEEYHSYILELIDMVPSTASVASYVEVVENNAIERRLYYKLQELADNILKSEFNINELLELSEKSITDIVRLKSRGEFVELRVAAKEVLEKITSINNRKSGLTGLDTGYPNLNRTTLGFQPGDLMILAARPSVGKSTYAINLAMNIAKINNSHVAFFSLEMSIEQLLMRIYALEAQIELSKIRKGDLDSDSLLLLKMAEENLKKTNIYFDASSSTNVADIRSKCRQLKQLNKLDFIVIDYLQLVTLGNGVSKGNRQEEVSHISRELKRLAQELQVPILALSQLSRNVEGREDKRPQLSDLRESGSIEQDADIVMFIYRRSDVEDQTEANALNEKVEELAKIEKPKHDNKMIETILSIAKNRQGGLGDFDYHFYGGLCKFAEQGEFRKIIKKRQNNGMRRLNN